MIHDSYTKAIGMGIITDTTKSSLLALESEKKQLDDALSKARIRYKNFSREEIEYALRELANYDYATSKQKGALLNTFVHQVTISKSGEIAVQLNLFSYVETAKFKLEDLKRVRINADLLRQLHTFRTGKRVRFVCLSAVLPAFVLRKQNSQADFPGKDPVRKSGKQPSAEERKTRKTGANPAPGGGHLRLPAPFLFEGLPPRKGLPPNPSKNGLEKGNPRGLTDIFETSRMI